MNLLHKPPTRETKRPRGFLPLWSRLAKLVVGSASLWGRRRHSLALRRGEWASAFYLHVTVKTFKTGHWDSLFHVPVFLGGGLAWHYDESPTNDTKYKFLHQWHQHVYGYHRYPNIPQHTRPGIRQGLRNVEIQHYYVAGVIFAFVAA